MQFKIIFFAILFQAVAVAQTAREDFPALSVSGEAEVSVNPDRATLRFGVTEVAQTAASAQQSVNRSMNAILRELDGLGIQREKIQTDRVQLYPIQERNEKDRKPYISGYRASNTLQVTLDDVDRIGEVLDAATKVGGNEVQGIDFQLKDDSQARAEALRMAVADARAKAQVMAEALGVHLLRVLEVGESTGRPVPIMARSARLQAESFESTPVSPGQIKVTASVNIRYEIGQ